MSTRKPAGAGSVARYLTLIAAAALAASLAACTSQLDMADSDVQRAAPPPASPAAHDGPAARDPRVMSAEERQRISDELAAARERLDSETTGTVPAQNPRPSSR